MAFSDRGRLLIGGGLCRNKSEGSGILPGAWQSETTKVGV